MRPRFYTVGMAGHIDHGKTTLTKALTGVDTDRLKEEKKRQISIELGYAPFPLDEYHVSIVDVPGHEKFIRQMIAGVAGIDLVVLVIAADEGVMPQTKEHLEILSFLGITHGIIAVTKTDKVESDFLELIEDDIREAVKNSPFEHSAVVFVDSITGTGLDQLKATIKEQLRTLPERNVDGTFRLPIDQVFTVQGHGTIVRGTIYEGMVETGELLTVLPQKTTVKARELQFHNQSQNQAFAGQRTAIKISGLSKGEVRRGDVLVASSSHFQATDTIDIALTTVSDLQYPLKQRSPVKLHSGTAEVMGKIVLFDRNEVGQGEDVLCQIRLEEPVVLRRGDRFVIRRPSPVETIGGGWVIEPLGGKYRFGQQTIQQLQRKREGSPEDRILDALNGHPLATKSELSQFTSLSQDAVETILLRLEMNNHVLEIDSDCFTSVSVCNKVENLILEQLAGYHEAFPLRDGMNKAECIQVVDRKIPKKLTEKVIDNAVENGRLTKQKQYISLANFEPHFPKQWKTRMEHVLERLLQDSLRMRPWDEYLTDEKIPEELWPELKHYLLGHGLTYALDDKYLIHRKVFDTESQKLYNSTNGQDFGVQEAKPVLEVSRHHLILLLELLDAQKITQRTGDKRTWRKEVQ